ncbi:UNVERIFIED_CONTAM: hypothetical protein Sradi_2928600 [Sesamum radiatum]|uniref:Uncharacterized protein n=1 Tax=Sesamum radiatum TaxID=300843 RepID=A0AAW2RZ32_SESRA
MEMEGADVSGTSPLLDASIGSVEPLIGLKLGKRTYFENSGAGGMLRRHSSCDAYSFCYLTEEN